MTEQTPPVPTPPAAPAPTPPEGTPPEKQPPWGSPENFTPDKAWELIQSLRAERGDPAARQEVDSRKNTRLREEVDQLKQSQTQQRDALAKALGVKPEETSDTDKLARQIDSLRGQILDSEKRALAVEFKVPVAMLTAADAEGLRSQATALKEFAEAAHYAATTSQPPPPFEQNAGQGQGNTTPTLEALAVAEYEKYYPSTPSRG